MPETRSVQTALFQGKNVYDPWLDGMDGRVVGVAIREVHQVQGASEARFKNLEFEFRCDDEVITDFWTLRSNRHGRAWEIWIHYGDMAFIDPDAPFDYERLQSRYRGKKWDDPTLVKFWLNGARLVGDASIAREDLQQLWSFARKISLAAASAEDWVASGLHVRVMCRSFGCTDTLKVLPVGALAEFIKNGADLSSFVAKLTCRKCGKTHPKIIPYEAEFSS